MTPTQQMAFERSQRFHADIARKALELKIRNTVQPQKPVVVSVVAAIQRECCRHFEISLCDLLSQRRTVVCVAARQIGMFLTKEKTRHSYAEIGRRFGDRDHATALYACRKIERLIKADYGVHYDVKLIRLAVDAALA